MAPGGGAHGGELGRVGRREPAGAAVHEADRGKAPAQRGDGAPGIGLDGDEARDGCRCRRQGRLLEGGADATLTTELVEGMNFPTRAAARAAIFEYIEVFYNRQRLHSTLGYRTAVEYRGKNATPAPSSRPGVHEIGGCPNAS